MYHSPPRGCNEFGAGADAPAGGFGREAGWQRRGALGNVRPSGRAKRRAGCPIGPIPGTCMIDFALQRKNMVESQVRPSDVTDRRIIRAMLEVPREAFVPAELKSVAYMDDAVRVSAAAGPRSGGRAMMAPRTLAKLLQSAELEATDVVLTVGCANGYASAVIARIVQTVVALESDAGLAADAGKTLGALSTDNVAVVTGPLAAGYPSEGPYDAIVVEGAIPEPPRALLDQLKDGGRLVALVSEGPVGKAVVWRRLGETFDQRPVFDGSAPPLPGFERAPAFVL